ncbi:hypothetical protein [Salinibius halmophilus]|uniref:hypothetical protein n=1 Tax=Salinibius halmophilus TaxID=1853216 RepID=UPI000E66B7BB|nr:hypothetical protein [Salinibius halmophilus]
MMLRVLLLSLITCAALANPRLAFTDLVHGPQSGLNDGLGEGAIVTLWGHMLGDEVGQVELITSDGSVHTAAHIYYWTRATGELPGGPAELWSSHRLYEVAFSLPSSLPNGEVSIRLLDAKGNKSANTLPFTVQPGNIYHVKTGGDNEGTGSFDDPWQVINGQTYGKKAAGNGGNGGVKPGDIVYSHGVVEVQEEHPLTGGSSAGAGLWLVNLKGTADNQIAFASYPNTQAVASGWRVGVKFYLTEGVVISKYKALAGNLPEPMVGTPYVSPNSASSVTMIGTNRWGRAVGNYLAEREGMCANGWSGAFVSGGNSAEGFRALGNHIVDIGCDQTSHFHHTTYFSIRDEAHEGDPIDGWEFAWNHLADNKAKFGIHFYDQNEKGTCRSFKPGAKLSAHNNYIINQKGSAINIHNYGRGTTINGQKVTIPCWQVDVEVYQNIIVNSGLGPVAELNNGVSPYGITLGGAMVGHFEVFNNLVYRVSEPSSRSYDRGGYIQNVPPTLLAMGSFTPGDITFDAFNNLMVADYPMEMVRVGQPEYTTIEHNLWYNTTMNDWTDAEREEYLANTQNGLVTEPQLANNLPTHLSPVWNQGRSDPRVQFGYFGNRASEPYIGPLAIPDQSPQAPSNFTAERLQ